MSDNDGCVIMILFLLLGIPAFIALEAWLFMLTIGIIHHEWLPMMPTIGYWSAVKVVAIPTIAGGVGYGIKSWN